MSTPSQATGAADLPSNYAVRGKNISFGSTVINNQSASSSRGVSITPLPAGSVISKILLKAVTKTKKAKKAPKTFTLRNVNTILIRSPETLKKEIQKQFRDDILSDMDRFDIGYLAGTNVVHIRNSQDLLDIWNEITHGQKHILWCDGLNQTESKKRSSSEAYDSDEDSEIPKCKKKRMADDKEEKVSRILDQLKKKHGDTFTSFQLRIWSEMVVGGIYVSLDNPPNTSMFVRAGGGSKGKKNDSISLSDAVGQISTAITSLTSPPKTPVLPTPVSSSSPAKSIDNRSKCYKQLNELNGLKMSGVLSAEEFDAEKTLILNVLKKLT